MAKKRKPKKLPYAVPEEKLLVQAREIFGWSLHSYGSQPNAKGRVVTRLEFRYRGGLIFPDSSLKIAGVDKVHSYVNNGNATVWVTWKSAALIL